MIIETFLSVALLIAEQQIAPSQPESNPPAPVCSVENGEPTCYPVDQVCKWGECE